MKITKETLKKIIKEEIQLEGHEEYEGWEGAPEFSESEERVKNLLWELTDAVDEMGHSSPELTDDYIRLFRSLRDAGLNLEFVAASA